MVPHSNGIPVDPFQVSMTRAVAPELAGLVGLAAVIGPTTPVLAQLAGAGPTPVNTQEASQFAVGLK